MTNNFTYITINDLNKTNIDIFNLDLKLVETESKHFVFPDLHRDLLDLSNKVNYNYSILGSHHKNNKTQSEIERINNMKNSLCKRPARFVITKDGRVWADNTHWTLSFILENHSACIKDIPSYIVDFRNASPIIVNINGTVYDSVTCILNAIECAYTIQNRVDKGWRPISIKYSINDLFKELYQYKGDKYE